MSENVKFYEKTWFIILMLFLFAPLGVFLMWKYTDWNEKLRIILSIVFGILFFIILIGLFGDSSVEDNQNSVKQEQQVEENIQEDEDVNNDEQEKENQEKQKETQKPAEDKQSKLSDDEILEFLESQEGFEGHWGKMEKDGVVMFVFYPEGDLADAFRTLILYPDNETLRASAETMKEGMCSLSKSLDSVSDKPCTIGIANPENEDNILYAFMWGSCTYDAFE